MTPTTFSILAVILLLTLFVHLPTTEATTNPADVWKTSGNYQIGYCDANVPGFNIPQAAYLQALLPTIWSHLKELLQDITLGTSSTHGYTAFFKTNSNLEAVRQVFQDIADGSPILTGTWDKNTANFTGPLRWTKPVIVCVNPGESDTIKQQQNCYESGNAISVAHVGRHSGAVSLCPHFFDLPRTARRGACPLFDPVLNRFVGHSIDFTRTQYAILVHELVHIYNIPEGMPEEVYDIQGAVNLDAVASFENAQNFAYYAAAVQAGCTHFPTATSFEATIIVKRLYHSAITISSSRTTMESEAQPHMEDDTIRSKAAGALNETSGPPKSFALFALPREIRDMIYSELVSSRNIDILRASKTIHAEASIVVHQQAICRLNTDYPNSGTLLPHINLSKLVTINIQHLDIKITFPPLVPKDKIFKYTPLTQFGGAEIVRKTCHVTFVIVRNVVMRGDLVLALDYLQILFGFRYVSVKVDNRAPSGYLYSSPGHTYIVHGTPENLNALLIGHIKVSLETTMGPASVRDEPGSARSYSEDGEDISAPRQFLEFHPRAHLQANRHAHLSMSRLALMFGIA